MSGPRYRVVQGATGNIGSRALREVIRHPALELAGVLVYDPAKVGVDAGLLLSTIDLPPITIAGPRSDAGDVR